jgi:hypothetical protein
MQHNKLIPVLSLPLATMLMITSAVGIFTFQFYGEETLNWQAQSVGQDLIDLFLVMPCLVLTSFFAARGNRTGFMLWGGVMIYLTYTFVIYCFDVHFNKLFLLYCAELGLSFYGCIIFFFTLKKDQNISVNGQGGIFKLTGIYFLVIASLFFLLWLSEILPSIMNNATPSNLADAGLFTNPVHVLDLAVVLPGIFITGILILRKNNFGLMIAPALLMFFILMDLTIGFLVLLMFSRGLEGSPTIAIVMAAIGVFSFVILKLYLKRLPKINP